MRPIARRAVLLCGLLLSAGGCEALPPAEQASTDERAAGATPEDAPRRLDLPPGAADVAGQVHELEAARSRAFLEQHARAFLEDLSFRDFQNAASYHTHEDQGKADIPRLIERLFKVKPEQLSIRDLGVTRVDLDSEGRRAKTFFRVSLEMLNTARNPREEENRERQVEGILYWHKRPLREAFPPSDGTEPDEADAVAEEIRQVAEADPGGPAADGECWFMMLESSLR